jgi:hypothetical protein
MLLPKSTDNVSHLTNEQLSAVYAVPIPVPKPTAPTAPSWWWNSLSEDLKQQLSALGRSHSGLGSILYRIHPSELLKIARAQGSFTIAKDAEYELLGRLHTELKNIKVSAESAIQTAELALNTL